MPTTSQRQFRYFQAVAHGSALPPPGMTRAKAAEFVDGQSPKGLPETAHKAKKKPLRKKLGKLKRSEAK